MKILKRNQIIISVIALMLITVGYMNFTTNLTSTVQTGALIDAETMAGIGDAKLVNSNEIIQENGNEEEINNRNDSNLATNISSTNSDSIEENNLNNNANIEGEIGNSVSDENKDLDKTKTTSAGQLVDSSSNYFVISRLERDKMYSQILDSYEGILKNESVSAEQKGLSTQEIANINNRKNSIMIAENLIKNLGFEDVVIFVNENSVSVIIRSEKLEEADVAQIQNIVCREIGVETEKIHISLK